MYKKIMIVIMALVFIACAASAFAETVSDQSTAVPVCPAMNAGEAQTCETTATPPTIDRAKAFEVISKMLPKPKLFSVGAPGKVFDELVEWELVSVELINVKHEYRVHNILIATTKEKKLRLTFRVEASRELFMCDWPLGRERFPLAIGDKVMGRCLSDVSTGFYLGSITNNEPKEAAFVSCPPPASYRSPVIPAGK